MAIASFRHALWAVAGLLLASPALAAPAAPVNHAVTSYHGCPVHLLTVTPGARVVPVAERPGRTLEAYARARGAIAGINGGYFNHSDGWPVSHVQADGRELTKPEQNEALLRNTVLRPYLRLILGHRAEWRHVTRPTGDAWRIAFHDAPPSAGEWTIDALQAGPQLLPKLDLEDEAFVIRDGRGRILRDGIGSTSRATRSALALMPDNRLLLVGVGAPGLSLADLAAFLRGRGASQALNLDGGSSTGLVWQEPGRLAAYHGGHASAPLNSVLLVLP